MRIKLSFFLLSLLLAGMVSDLKGQELYIKRATTPVIIDGIMDEGAWIEADIADRFHQNFPYDSSEAIAPTEVRMTYDEMIIYI